MPPAAPGPAEVATSGTPAPGVQPVGSLGAPGALKLPVGLVKLERHEPSTSPMLVGGSRTLELESWQ